jgi:hypothetical protein
MHQVAVRIAVSDGNSTYHPVQVSGTGSDNIGNSDLDIRAEAEKVRETYYSACRRLKNVLG